FLSFANKWGWGGECKLPPAQHCRVLPRLQVLLSLLVLLLLLLGGSLFLAWRIVRKRVKAGENPKPLRTHSQNTLQGELYYANLELQTRTLQGEPVQPRQEEVEYSTVKKASLEELHYSLVVFDPESQDSKANRIPSRRTLEQEPEYSVIKKT
uniref:CMRF35-like molecule 8 n=1 Tax=Panthera onca TaxID=9690 RepID=UPI002955BFCE